MKELWNSVVIRYDELTTKKDNRFAFIAILKENLNKQLSLISPLIQIIAKHDYAYLFFSNSLTSVVINKLTSLLQHTFGISSFSYAKKTSIELAQMEYESELILRRYAHSTDKKFTFKVEVIRSYKKAPGDSGGLKKHLGIFLLTKTSFEASLLKPKIVLNLLIKKEGVFIWFKKRKGLGGLPLGSTGQALLLLSGGIDSAVAGFFLMKRGIRVTFLHFTTPAITKPESITKVRQLVNRLRKFNNEQDKLIICDGSLLQREMMHIQNPRYLSVIIKRMFMRIASQIATILKLPILATGDAFSQVASQTVTNLINTDEIIHQQLIMRPLICFNKDEIIKWSKKIKTYQISILPFEDCCSLLVPKHPILNSELDKILTQEKSINKNINWEKILNFIVEQTITSLRE